LSFTCGIKRKQEYEKASKSNNLFFYKVKVSQNFLMKVFSLVSVVLVAAIQDGNPNDRIAKIEEHVQVCFLNILFVI